MLYLRVQMLTHNKRKQGDKTPYMKFKIYPLTNFK